MNITYTLTRGLEEYELEVEYSIEGADPSVGLGSAAFFEGATVWMLHDTKWHPFALLPKEEDDLDDWLQNNADFDDYYEEYDYEEDD